MTAKTTIKLTANQLLTAMPIVSAILRERRPMPQKGKFAFARMHAALLPHWNRLNTERDELIKSFDHHPVQKRAAKPEDGEEAMVRGWVEETSEEFSVPEDKLEDFAEQWKPIGEREIEIDAELISMKHFDLGAMSDGSIEGAEIIDMGNLITE